MKTEATIKIKTLINYTLKYKNKNTHGNIGQEKKKSW